MKTFAEYLNEGRKQYKFTVKLSFKPEDQLVDVIEKALNRYDLDSISRAKSLPIKKQDPHFPKVTSPETYALDVVTNYPATADMIKTTINQIGVRLENIAVVGTNHDISVATDETARQKNTSDAPLLLRDLEASSVKVAELSGDEYNSKLVKNSISRKTKFKGTPADTLNNYPTGNTSPLGSTKVKQPKISSNSR